MRNFFAFFRSAENVLLTLAALSLSLVVYFYTERKSTNFLPVFLQASNILNFLFFIFTSVILGILAFFNINRFSLFAVTKKLYLSLLPMEISLIIGLFITHSNVQAKGIFFFFTGAYIAAFGLYLILKYVKFDSFRLSRKSFRGWLRKQGNYYIGALILIVFISGFFGSYQIGNFAAVDEPLWTFDRIPGFWKNIGEKDWKNTTVSDKPGVTVAAISGIGLLKVNPMLYKSTGKRKSDLDVSVMNKALRLPLLIFSILTLFFLYIVLEQFVGKKVALFAIALIGFSPPILGISRLINPDGLLWTFGSLALFSYLAYLKKRHRAMLFAAGISLGLALLTKYVANIIYVFFFGLVFFEYFFSKKEDFVNISAYFRRALLDFASVTIISLITFYAFYPATWVRPEKLFKGTLLSQAFVSTAPIFIGIIALLLIDTLFLKNKILGPIMLFLRKRKQIITSIILIAISISIIFTFINVYGGMHPFDFEQILSSPKSSYLSSKMIGIFLANFYPLIFATMPLALFASLYAIIEVIRKKTPAAQENHLKTIIYCSLFVLLYYLGTTVNNVASPVRYQIILFPIILIMAAIGFDFLLSKLRLRHSFWILWTAVAISGIYVLQDNKPFYLAYASKLLPSQYIIDVKDMGTGSYEAAQFLNTIPDAENISIWTDKRGVCTFFVGRCFDGFSFAELENADISYVVVSSGRDSRTTTISKNRIKLNSNPKLQFWKYYDQQENIVFDLEINGRPGQYVRVFEAK